MHGKAISYIGIGDNTAIQTITRRHVVSCIVLTCSDLFGFADQQLPVLATPRAIDLRTSSHRASSAAVAARKRGRWGSPSGPGGGAAD